jgi:hypothetical protein
MTNQIDQLSNLYALLIGISSYLPNRLPGGNTYRNLSGCVRDISQMEEFLKGRRGVPTEHILKLTATSADTGRLCEPPTRWPTYENMVAAFRQLTQMAKPGEQVYIHYSGHGGRARTLLPDLKAQNGIDEVLVPFNIGSPDARYLRDVELAYLLQEMRKKDLLVTLVLDCCHSGGATRGERDQAVRGLGSVDTTPRLKESLVASQEALARTWLDLQADSILATTRSSGWLPRPQGYVLLAACLSYEKAYEYAFDGRQKNGVLTYWLLDCLQRIKPGFTYKQLHDTVVAKVHGRFARQTPQLEGDANRIVFTSEQAQSQYAVTVMRKDTSNKRVLINAGQVHPLAKGAKFAIFPSGIINPEEDAARLAVVSVTQLGATDSWAAITRSPHDNPIEEGMRAVLLDPGSDTLRSTVSLYLQDALPPSIDQHRALQRLEAALQSDGLGLVRLANDYSQADYQVTINTNAEYIIGDRSGQILPNLRPKLHIADSTAPVQVVQRLVHLTMYRNVESLRNTDFQSPLTDKLAIEILGKQRDYTPMDPLQLQPFNTQEEIPLLEVGEWLFLSITNNAPSALNIAVLNLGPDWSISQVPLFGGDIYFVSFDPGQHHIIPFLVDLPRGYRLAKQVIKIFGTRGTTSFRWLELPSLDQPLVRTRGAVDVLKKVGRKVWLAMNEPASETHELHPSAHPSKEWVTAQIGVFVQRS